MTCTLGVGTAGQVARPCSFTCMMRTAMDLAKITVGILFGSLAGVVSAHGLTPIHRVDDLAIPAIATIVTIVIVKVLTKAAQPKKFEPSSALRT